jgi:hypothetical protein
MAARVLVDTGPIVAYLHRGDAWHEAVVRFFRRWRGELLTTWPVVTAVSLDAADAARIERLYRKYADQNPDLADLSLLAVAERTGVRDILTIDIKDFAVYRLSGGRALNNLLARVS